MRKFKLFIAVLVLFASFNLQSTGTVLLVNNLTPTSSTIDKRSPSMERIASMKIKELEKLLGRKLSLKEKIGVRLAQYKIKKELRSKAEDKSKGQTAMILGIIGLAVIIIPYGLLASIPLAILAIVLGTQARKQNKNDGKAQAGIILGIVTLGLVALAFAIVLVVIATWSWGW